MENGSVENSSVENGSMENDEMISATEAKIIDLVINGGDLVIETEDIDKEELEEEEEEKVLEFKDLNPYANGKFGFPEDNVQNDFENTLGLEDEIPQEVIEDIRKQIVENFKKNDIYNIDKNLVEEENKIKYQNFVVVSFTGPKFTAKTSINGMRVMGAFDTVEEAQDYIQELEDKTYDTCIVEMYKYVPSFPFLESNVTQDDVDNFLNDIIVKYKFEREEARLIFEYRKNKLMKNKNRYVEKPKTAEQIELEEKIFKEEKEEMQNEEEVSSLVKEAERPVARNKTHQRLLETLENRRKQNEGTLQKKKLNSSRQKVEYQNYVIISYVGNTGSNNRVVMNIKGVFNTYKECEEHCEELRTADDTYDLLIADMYSWIPCDPNIEEIRQVHTEEKLNNLIKGTTDHSKLVSKVRDDMSTFEGKEHSKMYRLQEELKKQSSIPNNDTITNANHPLLGVNEVATTDVSSDQINYSAFDNDVVRIQGDGSIRK